MRKLIRLILIAGVGIIFQSCKDADDGVEQKDENPSVAVDETKQLNIRAIYSTNHKIETNEAREIAENSAEKFFSNSNYVTCLRSSNPRFVAETVALTKQALGLRSSSDEDDLLPDTLAYILNFADSLGFAIVAADDRVGDLLLACTDKGAIEDEVDNPGLAIFLENVEDYVKNSILEFEEMRDSLEIEAELQTGVEVNKNNGLRASKSEVKTEVLYSKVLAEVSPLVKTTWGQHSPYNKNIKLECGDDHAPTGCVATALGQVMAYWQISSVYGYSYDWKGLTKYEVIFDPKSDEAKEVAKLMAVLGEKLNMKYTCSGSSASMEKALNIMKSFGYKTYTSGYSSNDVIVYLNKRAPILMSGYKNKKSKLFGLKTTYSGGHCWIVDGYKKMDYLYGLYTNNPKTGEKEELEVTHTTSVLIHNNWGYDGDSNGWFLSGVFDLSKAYDYDCIATAQGINYQYKNEIYVAYR